MVAEDAAVCPRCDTVLDPSLLDASPPDQTNAPTARSARPARPTAPKKKRKRPPPPATQPKRDWRDEISPEDWNTMPQGPKEQFVADKGLDPDDVMGEARQFVHQLATADKVAFFGLALMGLACFLPWKETVSEGDVLGLLSSGVVVLAAALAGALALAARVRRSPSVNPLVLWVAQVSAVGIATLWCLVYAATSWDSTLAQAPVGNYEVWVSKPSLGLLLAFLAGVLAGLGTILGLKETK